MKTINFSLSFTLLVLPVLSHATLSETNARFLAKVGASGASSETYARIGELLLMDGEVEYADEMFDLALSHRADEPKALVYSALTKILLPFKGIQSRIQFSEKSSGSTNSPPSYFIRSNLVKPISRSIRNARIDKNPAIRTFLSQPSEAASLKNYEDVRRFASESTLPALKRAETIFKNLEGKLEATRFLIDLHELSGRGHSYYYSRYCYQDSRGNFHCNTNESTQEAPGVEGVKIDNHTLTVIQATLKYYTTAVTLATAYRLDEVENFSEKLSRLNRRSGNQNAQYRNFRSLILRFPNLFKIANADQLKTIPSELKTLMDTLFEIDSETFCGRGKGPKIPVLCTLQDNFSQFTQVEKLISGEVRVLLGYTANYQPVIIRINAPAIFINPLIDLKAMLPEEANFDNLPDPSLGGFIPGRDLASKLNEVVYPVPVEVL